MWYDAGALGVLMCITGGDLDLHSKLRVGELVVSVLMLFTVRRLFHGLQVYSFFDLTWC